MKITALFFIFLTAISPVFAQLSETLFFETDEAVKADLELGLIAPYSLLDINTIYWNNLLDTHPETVLIEIPFDGEVLQLDLQEVELFKGNLTVRTASGVSVDLGAESKSVFYQGSFIGYPNSHFALSILNNEVIGVGSIPGIGDVNLGVLKSYNYYIFCNEAAIAGHNSFSCETSGEPVAPFDISAMDARSIVEDCVGIYFEVDYDIFLSKGGVIEAADYITALFNEIQLLYELDEMTVFISDIMVWDEESPYFGIADTGILLDLFGTTTTVWDGDLGHLVTLGASGGLAWLDVFCSPSQALRKAVSGISPFFDEVPVYSWSVEVVSHEMGHNMGSPHTHACFWNGDMTAIDGCGPDAGYDEGCAAPLPADGGTVMSYCHLTAVGIDLAFGFGDQPATHIRSRIEAAACLESCDLQVMDVEIISGTISPACDNSPVFRELIVKNNGNENLTFFTTNVYLDGVFIEAIPWAGLIPEGDEGLINFPPFSLPVGSYNMQLEIEFPDGYPDEDASDNTFTFVFDVTPFPEASFTPSPSEMVSYNAVSTMVNSSTGAVSYWWDFDDGITGITETNPTHSFPFGMGGVYTVKLLASSPEGCVDTAKASVVVEGVNIFFIPNTFTPDGDDFNDTFRPVFAANLDVYDYHLAIYNRWGEMMFESYNVFVGWDGRYGNNGLADEGVYVWEIEFGDLSSDEKHYETGHITLLK